jgi:hypothetical protein
VPTAIEVYKRYWSEEFLRVYKRKEKGTKKKDKHSEGEGLLKLPQLRKSKSDAFGDFYLMISTSCLDKSSEKHARLIHSSNRPDNKSTLTNTFAN